MENEIGNYTAFYVSEPFNQSALGANATPDFVYYRMLTAWKGKDSTFPFTDSHETNYDVRDGSDWEKTLKPRLRERLRCSKNIILFLSSHTKSSRALREEIDYGINELGLPVIVIYPEFKVLGEFNDLINKQSIRITGLWDYLPIFRDSKQEVPVLHIPLQQNLITRALKNPSFMINTKAEPNDYILK